MCTCGNASYAVRTPAREEVRSRWRRIPAGGGSYGRFELPVAQGVLELYCAACGHVRRSRPVGGGTPMAYAAGPYQVQVVMTDVAQPSCMRARLVGPTGRYYLAITPTRAELAVAGTPLEQASEVPADAIAADYVYTVALPVVSVVATYQLVFIDDCLRITRKIADLLLSNGVHTLYGRSGDVVAVTGDYVASKIETAEEGVSVAGNLDALQAELALRADRAGDLGGTATAPLVVGIRGRGVRAGHPTDGAELTFSTGTGHWDMTIL